jgi:hypothetical protein
MKRRRLGVLWRLCRSRRRLLDRMTLFLGIDVEPIEMDAAQLMCTVVQ